MNVEAPVARPCVSRPFHQVDVFTARACRGNPLAVVLDAEGLDSVEMQSFADWTNLSETCFVLPPAHPDADYRVRIFAPGRELPFAGHPTLGTCHVWRARGGRAKGSQIVQECGAGLVNLREDGARLYFEAPALRRSGPLDAATIERIAHGLGLKPRDIEAHAWCDNGPAWQSILLRSVEQLRALQPNHQQLAGLDIGIVAASPPGADCAFEVRAFFSAHGAVVEDPVTGSLNAALGHWLIGCGRAPERYVASQGTALGRDGRVHVERDAAGRIWVGGDVTDCVQGEVRIGG